MIKVGICCMQKFQYPSFVEERKIKVEEDFQNRYRYLLEIPLKRPYGNEFLVIVKHPEKADQYLSDQTVDKILRFCYDKQATKVYIAYLYAFQTRNSKIFSDFMKKGDYEKAIGPKNDHYIKKAASKADSVIVAWGSNMFGYTEEYKERIKAVSELIKDLPTYYVDDVSSCNWYPQHPQVWRNNSLKELKPWTNLYLNDAEIYAKPDDDQDKVLSLPLSDTYELTEKYHVHTYPHPRSYDSDMDITFRRKGGVMDGLYSVAKEVLLDLSLPVEEQLDGLNEHEKERVLQYLQERELPNYNRESSLYMCWLLEKTEELPHSPSLKVNYNGFVYIYLEDLQDESLPYVKVSSQV
ncbi:DUF1643 domain-containing protein [Halobacillus fulvus]|nr:DUF1643 domain-containing protein [Halobacillus fulvus]